MKKRTKLLSVASIVVFCLLMVAGPAFAQGPDEGAPQDRPNRREQLAAAIADALNMRLDELKAQIQAGKTLEEIVEAQGMTRADLAEALYAAAAGRIEAALAEGKITQLQADRLLERMAQRRDACVQDGQCRLRPRPRPQRSPRRVQIRRMQAGKAIAEALQMTPQELAQAIRSGQTIEEIAAEQGLSMAELAETLYAAAESRIAEALANGKITQAQADRMLEALGQGRDACVVDGQCHLFLQRRGRR